MPVEGVLKPTAKPSTARVKGKLCYQPLLGERSESLSGEAPPAWPVEGVLNPINCHTPFFSVY